MKLDQWPDAKKLSLSADIDKFLRRMSVKYDARMEQVPLDRDGSYAFSVVDEPEESKEERDERLRDAEVYLRAWYNIVGSPLKLPDPRWSLYDRVIEVEFPAADYQTMIKKRGRIVDVDTQLFVRDPLIVLKNSAKKPKEDDPSDPYFELIECHASQVASFFPKDENLPRLVNPDGSMSTPRIIQFPGPKKQEDDGDYDGPEVS